MKCYFSLAFALPLTVGSLLAGSIRIYQTNSAGDAVDIIDPSTNKVVLQVTGIEVPHGVTFAPDGSRAYITCESESTLWATDTKSGRIAPAYADQRNTPGTNPTVESVRVFTTFGCNATAGS